MTASKRLHLRSMVQDITVHGFLSGVSMSTDITSIDIPRDASLVVTREDSSEQPLDQKISDVMLPRSPEPVYLALAVSASDDPEAGSAAFESDTSSDSPE
uniref:Uncharacterized protein n=1 Tax=Peronospora matthiolae TaxID=2874970 RepID=A0AAV1U8I5_9STRA